MDSSPSNTKGTNESENPRIAQWYGYQLLSPLPGVLIPDRHLSYVSRRFTPQPVAVHSSACTGVLSCVIWSLKHLYPIFRACDETFPSLITLPSPCNGNWHWSMWVPQKIKLPFNSFSPCRAKNIVTQMHETFIYAQTTLPPFGLQDPKIAPNKPQGSVVIQNTYQPPGAFSLKELTCTTVQLFKVQFTNGKKWWMGYYTIS